MMGNQLAVNSAQEERKNNRRSPSSNSHQEESKIEIMKLEQLWESNLLIVSPLSRQHSSSNQGGNDVKSDDAMNEDAVEQKEEEADQPSTGVDVPSKPAAQSSVESVEKTKPVKRDGHIQKEQDKDQPEINIAGTLAMLRTNTEQEPLAGVGKGLFTTSITGL